MSFLESKGGARAAEANVERKVYSEREVYFQII